MDDTTASTYRYNWFIHQFEKAEYRAGELFMAAEDHLLVTRPAPGTWSAADCLNHLVTFGNIYMKTLDKGLDQPNYTNPSAGQAFPPRLFWRWIIRFFEPPYKLKLKTVGSFKPKESKHQTAAQSLDQFQELQHRLVQCAEKARQNQIDLTTTKVPHPILPFLHMSLSECLALVDAHQRRHLWQAEQTIDRLQEKA